MKETYGQDVTILKIMDSFMQSLYLFNFKEYYQKTRDAFNEVSVSVELDGLELLDEKYTEFYAVDPTLRTYATINADVSGDNEIMSYDNYDKFLIKELRVPKNKLYIVDKTRGKYEKDVFGNEIVGIMPVVVTPANAMFYQDVIRKSDELLSDYNVLGKIRNSYRCTSLSAFKESFRPIDQTNMTVSSYPAEGKTETRQFIGLGEYLGDETFVDGGRVSINEFTMSQYAADHFPTIRFIDNRLERKYLSQIGIVVFKLFRDSSNDNKISMMPVEAFVGSLDRNAKDDTTGDRLFLDDIVNTGSDYINLFSNADIPDGGDSNPLGLKNASLYLISNQTACSMGFYERDTRKYISVTDSIYRPMLKIFERNQDKNTLDVDIMLDGGVTNIAQFIAST